MTFLLCSSGISKTSIRDALVELPGKPLGRWKLFTSSAVAD